MYLRHRSGHLSVLQSERVGLHGRCPVRVAGLAGGGRYVLAIVCGGRVSVGGVLGQPAWLDPVYGA